MHAVPGGRRHRPRPGRRGARRRSQDQLRDCGRRRPCGRWPSPTPCCRRTRPTDEDELHDRRDALESGPGLRRLRRHPRSAARRRQGRHRTSAAQAGIEVKMITGDNVETARAIGREIGLIDHAMRRSTRRTRRPDQRRVQRSLTDEELKASAAEPARPGPRPAAGQVPHGQAAAGTGRGRRRDRRRHQRRPGPEESRRRPGDGHRRHRGRQGSEQDRPARRRLLAPSSRRSTGAGRCTRTSSGSSSSS